MRNSTKKGLNNTSKRLIERRRRALAKAGYSLLSLSKITRYSPQQIHNVVTGKELSYGIMALVSYRTGAAHSSLWGFIPLRPSDRQAKNLRDRAELIYCPALDPDRPFRPAAECVVCEKMSCEGRIV